MLPNLFKIVGEFSPFCMHVAARSVVTLAMSIFCDLSDVITAWGTGYALLESGSSPGPLCNPRKPGGCYALMT